MAGGALLGTPTIARAITLPDSGTCSVPFGSGSCLGINNNAGGFAIAASSTSGGTGVSGQSFGTSGYGVYGSGDSGIGVYGTSGSGSGVLGVGYSGKGVYGYSDTGYAVYAYSGSGLGIYAQSVSGVGMSVLANGNVGAQVTSSNNDAIRAYASSGSRSGLFAVNSATSGGWGVYAQINGTGQAVHGDNPNSGGWAGYFNGKVYSTVSFTTSDARLKTDVKDVPYGLAAALKLRPVTFKWKADKSGPTQLGLIAQDVQKVIPELVTTADTNSGTLAVNYVGLVPVAIKAIQEQQATIERQNSRISALERELHTPVLSSVGSFGNERVVWASLAVGLALALRGRRKKTG